MIERTLMIFGKEVSCNFNYRLMGDVLETLSRNGVETTITGLQAFANQFSNGGTTDYDIGKNYKLFSQLAKQFDPDFDQNEVEDMTFTKVIQYHSEVLSAVTMLLVDRDPIDGNDSNPNEVHPKKKPT